MDLKEKTNQELRVMLKELSNEIDTVVMTKKEEKEKIDLEDQIRIELSERGM